MKTTLHIDPSLMRKLKAEAARQGRTMTELVEESLHTTLQGKKTAANLPPLPEFDLGGSRVDVSNREALYEALDRG